MGGGGGFIVGGAGVRGLEWGKGGVEDGGEKKRKGWTD